MTIYTDNTGDGLGAPAATASDTISGVDYPEMKIVLGAAGTAVLASAGQGTQDTGTLRVAVATAGTPKFATLQLSATGEVVAAVSGKKIRVLAARLSAAGTVNTKWQSASTDKTGLSYFVANSYAELSYSPVGWFETVAGEALNLNLSASIAVGGMIVYVEV
jgi:hypothetical protein